MFDIIRSSLGAAILDAGTFTIGYPVGRDAGSYAGGLGHSVVSNTYGILTGAEISLSFDATVVTITNNSGQTLAAGTSIIVQLDRIGADGDLITGVEFADPDTMRGLPPVMINLGAPIVADANGAVASQAATTGGLGTGINGALASGGVANFDVPRNVVAAWTNTAIITVTGTDVYGKVIVESSASGTSLAGKKAFKTVTGIAVNASVTGLTVGSGVVLGMPAYLGGTGYILKELISGAVATAGTTVGGVRSTATATTGDVRGTYSPDSAPNGARAFQLLCIFDDPLDKGVAQFAG